MSLVDIMTDAARAEIIKEIANVEAEIRHLLRKAKWADHPSHKYREAIVTYYAPKLAEALKDSVSGIHEAISVAQRKKAATKSLAKAGLDDAQDAVANNVTFQPQDAADVLRQMLGDSYLAGAHVGAVQVGGGAKVAEALEGADNAMNWDDWKPGWLQSAGNVRDGGLQDLLAQADADIKGITDTAKTRIGNVLADGIASGDSIQTIAANMTDVIASPERALVIANTETARSMVSATLSTYDQNGVDSWEWIAEDDACPECDELDGQSFDTSDSSQDPPPLHPSCRCATLPNVEGQDASQPPLDSGDDDTTSNDISGSSADELGAPIDITGQ